MLFSATCIEVAKADIEDIKEMIVRETEEGRLSKIHETKKDIERMTQSEMCDMKEWLKNCNNDLKISVRKYICRIIGKVNIFNTILRCSALRWVY